MRRRREHVGLDVVERKVVDGRVARLPEHERPSVFAMVRPPRRTVTVASAGATVIGWSGPGTRTRFSVMVGQPRPSAADSRSPPDAENSSRKSPRKRTRVSTIESSLVRGRAASTRTDSSPHPGANRRKAAGVGCSGADRATVTETRPDSIRPEGAPLGREWHDPLMPRRTPPSSRPPHPPRRAGSRPRHPDGGRSASTSASAAPPPVRRAARRHPARGARTRRRGSTSSCVAADDTVAGTGTVDAQGSLSGGC